MQIFGKNIKIENMYKLEPKVDLMDLVNVLIENIVSEYSNPDIRNIKETLTDGEIKIYPSGIIVRLHLNQNSNSEYIDKGYQIHCSYFYDYSKDSFCSSISGKIFSPNVGLLNV